MVNTTGTEHWRGVEDGWRWAETHVGPAEMGRSAKRGDGVRFCPNVIDEDIIHPVLTESQPTLRRRKKRN